MFRATNLVPAAIFIALLAFLLSTPPTVGWRNLAISAMSLYVAVMALASAFLTSDAGVIVVPRQVAQSFFGRWARVALCIVAVAFFLWAVFNASVGYPTIHA